MKLGWLFGDPDRRRLFAAQRESNRRIYLQTWHIYFTWYPVHLGYGDWRWLEKIYRRGNNVYSSSVRDDEVWEWDYSKKRPN